MFTELCKRIYPYAVILFFNLFNVVAAEDLRANFLVNFPNALNHQILAGDIRNRSDIWINNNVGAHIIPARNRLKIGLYGCNANGNCHFYSNNFTYLSGVNNQNNPNNINLRNIYPNADFNLFNVNNIAIINDFRSKGYDIRRKPLYQLLPSNNPLVIRIRLNTFRLIPNFIQTFAHSEQALTSHFMQAQNLFNIQLNNMAQYDFYIFLMVSTNRSCQTCQGMLTRLLHNQTNNFLLANIFLGNQYPWSQLSAITALNNNPGNNTNYSITNFNQSTVFFSYVYQGQNFNIQQLQQQNVDFFQYTA